MVKATRPATNHSSFLTPGCDLARLRAGQRHHLPCGILGVKDEVRAAPEAQAHGPGWDPGPATGVHLCPEHRNAVFSVVPSCRESEKGGKPSLRELNGAWTGERLCSQWS